MAMFMTRDPAAPGCSPLLCRTIATPSTSPRSAAEAVVSTDRKGRSMLRATWIGLLAVVGGLLAAPGRAAETAAAPKTYAVLVGVSQYADPQIKPRKHAEADAKALYDLMTDATYLGASADDVKLLLGTPDEKRHSQPATKANVVQALTEVAGKAAKDDLVLIVMI